MTTPASATGLAAIDHVVLMRENCWFDHLLGSPARLPVRRRRQRLPDWCVGYAWRTRHRCTAMTSSGAEYGEQVVDATAVAVEQVLDAGDVDVRAHGERPSL